MQKTIAALATVVCLSLTACSAVGQDPPIADDLAAMVAGVAAKTGCTGFTSHLDAQAHLQDGECTLNGSTLHILYFNNMSDQDMFAMIVQAAGKNSLGQGDRWLIYGSDSAVIQQATRAAGGRIPLPLPVFTAGGPTALCSDGTFSFAAHHQGACSYHGGVSVFY